MSNKENPTITLYFLTVSRPSSEDQIAMMCKGITIAAVPDGKGGCKEVECTHSFFGTNQEVRDGTNNFGHWDAKTVWSGPESQVKLLRKLC